MDTLLKTLLIPLTLTACSTAQTEQGWDTALLSRNTEIAVAGDHPSSASQYVAEFAIDSLYGSSSGTSQATNRNHFLPQNNVRPNRVRIGGDMYFADYDTTDTQVASLDLSLGWRLGGHFEIGPEVSLYTVDSTYENFEQYQVGPSMRFYFVSPSTSRWQPWMKLGLGVGVQDAGESDGFTYVRLGPGVSCFITPSFAFEASLQYERVDWNDSYYSENESTRFHVGISTFF
jgi:hypothetical protein